LRRPALPIFNEASAGNATTTIAGIVSIAK